MVSKTFGVWSSEVEEIVCHGRRGDLEQTDIRTDRRGGTLPIGMKWISWRRWRRRWDFSLCIFRLAAPDRMSFGSSICRSVCRLRLLSSLRWTTANFAEISHDEDTPVSDRPTDRTTRLPQRRSTRNDRRDRGIYVPTARTPLREEGARPSKRARHPRSFVRSLSVWPFRSPFKGFRIQTRVRTRWPQLAIPFGDREQ